MASDSASPAAAPSRSAPRDDSPAARFLRAHRHQIVTDLSMWTAIPSVAADPERATEVRRSAEWIAGRLREAGFTVDEVPTGGAVAIVATLRVDEAAPTVLVYSHHDVRHAKPEQWRVTDPFRPRVRGGRLYGRGASDAKGQVLAHLWAARASASTPPPRPVQPPVNLTFLIEGEEEIGSPHLRELLESRREQLTADVIVFSDTVQWPAESPSAVTSMRGTVTASLTVRGTARDVHSGVVSGAAPNAAHALVTALAALHDESGRIAVPGFTDDVAPLTADRRRELDDLPFDEARWLAETETRRIVGEDGFTVPERLWARPSIEVLTMIAGDPDGPARAVIPAEARAEISIRTVPDQSVHRVAELVRAFFADQLPDTVTYELEIDERVAQEAYTTPHGSALDALESAMARAYGSPPEGRMGNAGGGPADVLTEVIGAPVLFLGTGLPGDRWHAADESVDLEMLLTGAAALAHLWDELAGRAGEG